MDSVLKIVVLVGIAGGLIQVVLAIRRRRRERSAQMALWLNGISTRARVIDVNQIGASRHSLLMKLGLELLTDGSPVRTSAEISVPRSRRSHPRGAGSELEWLSVLTTSDAT